MRFRLIVVVILVLVASWSRSQAQCVCSGHVTGPGGKLLPAAHIALMDPDHPSGGQVVQASPDGAYRLTVPRPGFWILRFSGVGYAKESLALYVPGTTPIALNVSLGGYHYIPGETALSVIGDFNYWSIAEAVSLTRGSDGTYGADIPVAGDSITFRIRGYRDGDGAEGLRGATYILNSEGGYDARIRTTGGSARVRVDPSLLDRSGARVQVAVEGPEQTRRIVDAVRAWWEGDEAYTAEQSVIAMGRPHLDTTVTDWNAFTLRILRRADTEKDPLVRSVCALAYVSVALKSRHADAAALTRCMDRIPATSPAWSLNPRAMTSAVRGTSWPAAQRERYIEAAIGRNPSASVRVAVICTEFTTALNADQNRKAARYYDLLMEKYGDTQAARDLRKSYPRPVVPADTTRTGRH